MFAIVSALVRYPLSSLYPKHQLALEVLALLHQIAVLQQQTRTPKPLPSLPVTTLEADRDSIVQREPSGSIDHALSKLGQI